MGRFAANPAPPETLLASRDRATLATVHGLYPRRSPSLNGPNSLWGGRAVEALRGHCTRLVVSHLIVETGAPSAARALDVALADDLRASRPVLVVLEGSLFANDEGMWRVPRDLAEELVDQGTVQIVAGASVSDHLARGPAYAKAAGYFLRTAALQLDDGVPGPIHGADPASCGTSATEVICRPGDMDIPASAQQLFDGVDELVVAQPVCLRAHEADLAKGNATTSGAMHGDRWLRRP